MADTAAEQATVSSDVSPEAPSGSVGRHLVELGRVSPEDLARAARLAGEQGCSPWLMLLRLGLVAEKDLAQAFATVLELKQLEPDERPETPLFREQISPRFLHEAMALPLHLEEGRLHLAMADPTDGFVREAVEAATGCPVVPRVALPSEIESSLKTLYGEEGKTGEGERQAASRNEEEEQDVEALRDLASEAPVVRLVNHLIRQAMEARASDIHLEPTGEGLRTRFRVDGVLLEAERLPSSFATAIVSRIKLMARLDIAERRLPQDGRFSLRLQGRKLDLRVSTTPTLGGESVVMRLLDREEVRFDFDALGFDGEPRRRFERILQAPNGILLITGPTGSGKTTTLYTVLNRLNTPERKIITVEDPVEYRLAGINQIQVKPTIGLTFANALRSIVRQDPDVIMVGEMRDQETARIAVQSALTGHLVLSTLHTNDAASGVTRLLDMGIEPYLISATVNGIVAQRLVRRLCSHCATPWEPPQELIEELDLERLLADNAPPLLHHARGCSHCNGIGYRGRLALVEVLETSDAVHRLVMRHAEVREIRELAIAEGMTTLRQDGLRKALAGLTTLEEVARVAGE